MTKREIEKCERLMETAIKFARESQEKLEKTMTEENKATREILNNKGFEYYGYAQGVNHVLVELGFKHERMKELYKYI